VLHADSTGEVDGEQECDDADNNANNYLFDCQYNGWRKETLKLAYGHHGALAISTNSRDRRLIWRHIAPSILRILACLLPSHQCSWQMHRDQRARVISRLRLLDKQLDDYL
jgi:hypothetical protein